MRNFTIITATDIRGGIGLGGTIPWHEKEDLKFFKDTTINNVVIMGRVTFESLNHQPLKDRINIVLTSRCDEYKNNETENLFFHQNLDDALDFCKQYYNREIFVIGGAQLYTEALNHHSCKKLIISQIDKKYDCDRYLSTIDKETYTYDNYFQISSNVYVSIMRRKNYEEEQYLSMIKSVAHFGFDKDDRTGTGTKSLFTEQLRFSLMNNSFPLLTTKKVPLRLIFEELMWFLRGQTDSKILEEKGVNIWKSDTSADNLIKKGLSHFPEGELGKGYGHQWRNFGGEHGNLGSGYDQIKNLVNEIKTNPNSRRLILTAWNPCDMEETVLPPCHVLAQFYVSDGKYLSCGLYQRSGDIGLGVPFNIASYALLTILMAKVTGLIPKDFVHTIGDAHIYKNHLEELKKQAERKPYSFPKLEVVRERENIWDYEFEDIKLYDYEHCDTIKLDLSF